MITAAKPWVCRLYPERGSSLYARVYVWPTKREFLQHVNATCNFAGGRGAGRRCQGTCGRVEAYTFVDGRKRRSACFAHVNLWRGKLTMQCVTHEIFHATMAWAHRVGYDFAPLMSTADVTAHEERITYVNCELNRQFIVKASRPGAPYDVLGKVRSE